jgi:hypothetical protein
MYEESADGVIYFDNMLPHLSGSLFKSSMRQFNERVPLTDFSKYHGGEKMLRILPEKLRGFSPSRAKASGKLPGGYIYNGCFVVAGNVEIATNYLIWQPEGGKEIASRFKSSEFSDEGGNEWRLLTPHFRTLGDKRDIVDVRRPE